MGLVDLRNVNLSDYHGICGVFVPSRGSLQTLFMVSTQRWDLSIRGNLAKAAELSVIPELHDTAFAVTLLSNGNQCFS